MHFSEQTVLSLSAAFCGFLRFSVNFQNFFFIFPATFIEMLQKFPATFIEMSHKKSDIKCVEFAQISRHKMSNFWGIFCGFYAIYRNNSPPFIGIIPNIFIYFFLGNPHYFIVHFSALLFAHFPADRNESPRCFPPRFDIKCHSNSGGMPRIGKPKK